MHNESNISRSIAILVNPRSGKGLAVNTGKRLSELLSSRNIAHEIFSDQWPSALSAFSEVWLVGGDGTMNFFVNHYSDIKIPIVAFKGGTGNDFVWRLYGNKTIEEQFEHVLQAEVKTVDVLCCNEKLYVNSLGIGFDGEVLSSMGAIRWLGGHLGYLFAVIRKIFSFKEPQFKITSGAFSYEGKLLLAIVNNNSRTGGGFLVAPQASLSDGLADIVLCKPLPVLKRFRYLPVIEKGKHLEKPFIIFLQEGKVKVECDRELKAALDGELIKAKVFEIKVLPGFLRFKF
jgi:YegS/Rv2252/BmrU family lipid kinase